MMMGSTQQGHPVPVSLHAHGRCWCWCATLGIPNKHTNSSMVVKQHAALCYTTGLGRRPGTCTHMCSFALPCLGPPSLPDSTATTTTTTAGAGVCHTAPLEAAHAVVQAAPKQLDCQPLCLYHCQLEGVTLEPGAQVGVDGTTHALNDLQSQQEQQTAALSS